MSWFEWLHPLFSVAFTWWGHAVTWTEAWGFVLSLAMVCCNIKTLPWAWPLAIISSALYMALFLNSQLYGQAGLQGVFIAMALWGWWQWLAGRDASGQALRVRALPRRGWLWVLGAQLLLWPLLAWLLTRFTPSEVPWLDGFTTALSLVGTWLLARKWLDNWLVWVVVNAVSIALFLHQSLWLTALLYGVFLALSVLGWRQWRAVQMQAQASPAAWAAP
jgi:nicotinamide mononucleotide transporter